ncbi:MAG TPA: tripartite tricarboxylate transporter substrate binding protein [Pseudolabrys sp.]|jgi:tripartite-type tricarboxylate transporter receptor subunit TctC|nr:tripartite tricarboxylate transporter substrate binding protein [Pseudolabrys sp.]
MTGTMTISRRKLLVTASLTPVMLALPRSAFAAYPDRAIHLVVPFAAGGNADVVGRVVAEEIHKALKQPVVVDNRGGAGGSIGAEVVAKAEPDGYTLLVASNGPMTVNPFVQAKLGYDPLKDFAAIALTSYVPHCLALNPGVPAKTVAELVAMSKEKPVNIATSGVGSATHLTLERFNAATGAKFAHVPYRSGGQLLPDLLAGVVQGAMTEFSIALPQHKGGKVRIVGVASAQRSKLAPDIPTFIEGGVKDFTAFSYIGIVAPAKTPPAIIAQLSKAVADGLSGQSEAADKLRQMGSDIATPQEMTPDGFSAYLKAEFARSAAAAKLAGLTPK